MNDRQSLLGIALLLSATAGCDLASSAREPAEVGAASSGDGAAPIATPTVDQPAAPGATRVVGIPKGAPKVDANGFIESTFDDVKFEMDKADRFERSMLTPTVQALFDKRIRIRGYMYPALRRNGLKQFVLVRDNRECCFGPGAALYDCVLVTMAPGKTTEYSIYPIAVEGTFRLDEYPGPDGRPLAIYQMTGEAVE